MPDHRRWVIDTNIFTHFCRAGHEDIIASLAPNGVVLVPSDVSVEIERGRERYRGIPSVDAVSWAELTVLSSEEVWTQLDVKAQLGGATEAHLGECAVIACARHRNLIALLDDRAAVAQAVRLGVPWRDTLWIVIEAYARVFSRDREAAVRVVDDLLSTEMYLPVTSGESLMVYAYEHGLLS